MITLRTLISAVHKGWARLAQIASLQITKRRGSHNQACLIELIDPATAARRLSIPSSTLEYLADASMIPHYLTSGEIRFEPKELNAWVHRHKIDEPHVTFLEDARQ
ncbi:MAG: hypothetical protein ACRDK2_02385 [Solirubrobacteraceae bacterium]